MIAKPEKMTHAPKGSSKESSIYYYILKSQLWERGWRSVSECLRQYNLHAGNISLCPFWTLGVSIQHCNGFPLEISHLRFKTSFFNMRKVRNCLREPFPTSFPLGCYLQLPQVSGENTWRMESNIVIMHVDVFPAEQRNHSRELRSMHSWILTFLSRQSKGPTAVVVVGFVL